MPTVLRIGPYRFAFYASDGDEPVHIHVFRDDCMTKFWVSPLRMAVNVGFNAKELRDIEKMVEENKSELERKWNSLAIAEREAEARSIEVTDEELIVHLVDGRTVSAPISWYPRLLHGTAEERNHYELTGRGYGIHWPSLDEDLSVRGLLKGNPSFESQASIQRWLDSRK